jgi:hypothetical protein
VATKRKRNGRGSTQDRIDEASRSGAETLSLGGDGIDSAARVHWPACATQGAEARQQQAYGAARGDSVLAEFASVGSRVTSAGIVQRSGTLSRKANIGPPTSTLSHSVTQTEFSAATGARDASRRAHPLQKV